MGVELEGAWDKDPHEVILKIPGSAVRHDGSVDVGKGINGEIVTRPHSRLDDLLADLYTLWPDYANDSCGLHIHTSFTVLDTSTLADNAFWLYFRRRWEAWGEENRAKLPDEFWDRFYVRTPRAKRYCKAEFIPQEQLSNHKDRYTQLNFVAWSKFKTLECRFLPMFRDRAMGFSAIREMSDIYDTYLNESSFPEIDLTRDIKIQENEVIETYVDQLPDISEMEESVELTHPKILRGNNVYYSTKAMGLMLPWATTTEESEMSPIDNTEEE